MAAPACSMTLATTTEPDGRAALPARWPSADELAANGTPSHDLRLRQPRIPEMLGVVGFVRYCLPNPIHSGVARYLDVEFYEREVALYRHEGHRSWYALLVEQADCPVGFGLYELRMPAPGLAPDVVSSLVVVDGRPGRKGLAVYLQRTVARQLAAWLCENNVVAAGTTARTTTRAG